MQPFRQLLWGRLRSSLSAVPEIFTPSAVCGITVLLLFGLFFSNVYRAASQSVTYDEAFTYLAFLSGSPLRVFTEYTANNHVLFSLFAKFSIGLFGLSEFTLRLPTVLAGIVYFVSVFFLCRLLFGYGPLFLISVAALSLNPFVLDLLSAARGYGLALAFFLVSSYQVSLTVGRGGGSNHWPRLLASLALAVCVSSNIAFAPVCVSLGCGVLLTDLVCGRRGFYVGYAKNWFKWLCLPGTLVATAVLAVPVLQAEPEHFSFGARTFSRTVTSLLEASLWHNTGTWPISDPALKPDVIVSSIAWFIVAPVFFLSVGVSWWSVKKAVSVGGQRTLDFVDRFLLLITSTLVFTLVFLVCGYFGLGLPYPFSRTGLYFIPLGVLCVSTLICRLSSENFRFGRFVANGLTVLLVVLIVRYAFEFNVTYYYEWRYDAGTRAIFDRMVGNEEDQIPGRLRVASQRWLYSPALNFYRVLRGKTGDVLRIDDGWDADARNYDFFVVAPGPDLERAQQLARIVHIDPISGTVLLARRVDKSGP